MHLGLTGKVALVTGSSRGIGRRIAEVLSEEGCQVILNGRSVDSLRNAASALPSASFVVGDVTQPVEARRIVNEAHEKNGRLDIVICNVGDGRSVAPGKESSDEWQRVFAINLWSATNVIEAASPLLSASQGAIVCVSSICGLEVIKGVPVTYSAAKAALNAYVRGISRPLATIGVRINAVAPGNILFDGSVWSQKLARDPIQVQAMLDREVSLARLGTPSDVAGLVSYLASSKAAFVTGSIWTIDGGQVHGC